MGCGCSENKKLINNINNRNKTLNIQSIQNLSIDEIINLYKDGYRLDIETLNNDIYDNTHNNTYNDSSMKYLAYPDNCTGTTTVSAKNMSFGGYRPSLYMDTAVAQRFIPTSRCLDLIILRMRKVQNYDVLIDITNDNAGLPNLSSSLGTFTIPASSLDTMFDDIFVPIGIVLNNLNPIWIVVRSELYDPAIPDPMELTQLDGDMVSSSTQYSATKVGVDSWYPHTNSQLYFREYEKTYGSISTITVTSPNGGENWIQGSVHNITWTYSNITGNVKIELFKNNVLNATIVSSTPVSNGTYSWNIPSGQALGTDYSIKITSLSNPSILDSSNANFQISSSTSSSITVTSPNGGENWVQNSAHGITWTYSNLTGNVKIELFKGGILDTIISPSTAIAAGTYGWTVPSGQTVGIDYTVKITSLSNPSISDNSNANFQISTSSGIICQSISTPTAQPSTINAGNSTVLTSIVTPSSPTLQEFSVQFMEGGNPIGNPVTTVDHIATKSWSPDIGTYNVSAKVGIECESPGTIQVIVNPSSGGGGIVLVLAAVAGAAILLSRGS